MSLIRVFFVLLAVFAVSACSSTSSSSASAGDAASAGAAATVASTDTGEGDDGVICKRVQVTGTRLTEKQCTTAAQREARARAAKDAAAQVGVRAQQVGGPAGG